MFETFLDRTMSILRPTISQDASGGTVRTFATIATKIPAAVQSANSMEVFNFGRRDINVSHRVYTTTDLASVLTGGLKSGDVAKDESTGATYAIQGIVRSQNSVIAANPLYKIMANEVVL